MEDGKEGNMEDGKEDNMEDGKEGNNEDGKNEKEITGRFAKYFEIGFLFKASDNLKFSVLSDDDVSKTTENEKNIKIDDDDVKEKRKKKESKRTFGINEMMKKEQTCNERMLLTTDPGSIAVWTRSEGDCSAVRQVLDKIANIIGNS